MYTDSLPADGYDWRRILAFVMRHRRELIAAHVIAVLASVPLPLMLPLLADEVLLNVPGALVGAMR